MIRVHSLQGAWIAARYLRLPLLVMLIMGLALAASAFLGNNARMLLSSAQNALPVAP